ncbi:MAG TPA: ABC transporter ATP-binding protein [Pseudonocardiaceae bacterium]|jgi:peptide/nickel transport system ATP-binding protein/oligopeptide transport system ATP-binding protein|nr:ABC transporter ATP-binding protein [Pseudonocardiaceae bacterium]
MSEATMRLDHVTKTFRVRGRSVRAVQDVSLTIARGETLGLIGESGSGKSTLGRIAMGLTAPDDGAALFEDRPWTRSAADRPRRKDLSIVFQDPGQALDPRMTVGQSVLEPIQVHRREWSRRQQEERARAALRQASITDDLWQRFPNQLSGGQQQRVSIARAVATEPRFIVLDEPTASLDASVRHELLATLAAIQAASGVSYLLISHDMETIAVMAHRVAVLYRGMIVEEGPTARVLEQPRHPYTRSLISAVLTTTVAPSSAWLRLRGTPTLDSADEGCVLHGRCPFQHDDCRTGRVAMRELGDDHRTACLRLDHIDRVNSSAGDVADAEEGTQAPTGATRS